MPLEVFIAYSHKDRALRDELATHLSNLRKQSLISDWYDGDIIPGTEWKKQIIDQLNTAKIILLLISADFMASDFCYSIEMKQAIARHEAGEACVVPIILRPTDLMDAPFSKLQSLPTNAKPVTRWQNRDQALLDIVGGIRKAIEELTTTPEGVGRTKEQIRTVNPPLRTKEQWLDTGNQFFAREDYEQALHAYEQALHLDSNNALAYGLKGWALRRLTRFHEALSSYEQALRLDPNSSPFY